MPHRSCLMLVLAAYNNYYIHCVINISNYTGYTGLQNGIPIDFSAVISSHSYRIYKRFRAEPSLRTKACTRRDSVLRLHTHMAIWGGCMSILLPCRVCMYFVGQPLTLLVSNVVQPPRFSATGGQNSLVASDFISGNFLCSPYSTIMVLILWRWPWKVYDYDAF